MRKIFKRIFILATALCMIVSATACTNNGNMLAYDTFYYFNTQTRWAFIPKNGEQAGENEKAVWKQITGVLKDVEDSVSTDIETSSVSRFNAAAAGETVEIDATSYDILLMAKEVYDSTDGAYNPAVGLLVDLWGFSPRFTDTESSDASQVYDRENFIEEISDFSRIVSKLPEEKYISAFRDLTDFSKVELKREGDKYYATKPADAFAVIEDAEGTEHTYTMQLNLGGIGKGYAVDGGVEIIQTAGYDKGFFSVGGSSMSVFSRVEEGKLSPWDVAVNNPRYGIFKTGENGEYLSVREQNVCLSTSGDYENCYYYRENGRRFCHIINPYTGYPINADPANADGSGIVCASIFGISAAKGDAITTALLVMGKDKAIQFIQENYSHADVVFVYYDGAENAYSMYTNMQEESYKLYAELPVVKF